MQPNLPSLSKVLPFLVAIFCSLLTCTAVVGQVQLLKDINPGPGNSFTGSAFTRNPTFEVNGTLYFTADDGQHGTELWKTDGTKAGTVLVKDINPGSNGSNPDFGIFNGTLYFTADDGQHGTELWKTDGTTAGTMLVKDIYTGRNGSLYSLIGTQVIKGILYFSAADRFGYQLWKSDGTSDGTVVVTNNIASPHGFTLIALNNTLFFPYNDGTHGEELWKSDGTATGTSMVKDIFPGSFDSNSAPQGLTNVNGTLFFTANIGSDGTTIWKSDGTENGTVQVLGSRPSTYLGALISFNNLLYFSRGRELWRSDGTPAGTTLVKGFAPNSVLEQEWIYNGKLYFEVSGAPEGLWKTDGTSAGTSLATELKGSLQRFQVTAGKLCVFSRDSDTEQPFLYVSNTVNEFNLLQGSYTDVTGIGDTLYLLRYDFFGTLVTSGVYKSDGKMVAPLATGLKDASQLFSLQSKLYFWASDNTTGKELRKLDPASAPVLATPTITTVSPLRNAVNIARNANVGVTFSLAMDATTASSATIRVQGGQTGTRTLNGKGTFSGSANLVSFDPSTDFKAGEHVSVSVTTQARSTDGIPIEKPQVFTFTTATTSSLAILTPGAALDIPKVGSEQLAGHSPSSVANADLDGDGDLDLLVLVSDGRLVIGLNDGTGHFPSSLLANAGGAASNFYLQVADLDNDGDVDLVHTNPGKGATALTRLLNDGTGHFTGHAAEDSIQVDHGQSSFLLADLNGDGNPDLAVPDSSANTISVLLNDGTGKFVPASSVAVGNHPRFVQAADVDNDGDLDLAVANKNANTVSIRFNDGTAHFTGTTEVALANAPTGLQLADLDNDGDADLVIVTNSAQANAVSIRLNVGNGSFVAGAEISGLPVGASSLSVDDLNGDGYLDLAVVVAQPVVGGKVILQLNDHTGHFNAGQSVSAGNYPVSLATGDLDGDGDIDLSLADQGDFKTLVLLNQSTLPNCTASGSILREYWADLPGHNIIDIPVYNSYRTDIPPTFQDQLTSLRTSANFDDNYGQRIRGYLCAPVTGSYTFFIQGDDVAALYLSPDANPGNKKTIATATIAWQWNVSASQQSAPISLVAGQSYYLEVLHKEGSGNDQVRVGWRTPSMAADAEPVIIPGSILSPYQNPIQPPADLKAVSISTSQIQLTWVDASTGETGYVIERNNGEGFVKVATLSPNTTSYLDNLPDNNTTYSYRLYATSGQGASIYSPEVSATTYCQATGTIMREYWANVPGNSIASIPVNTPPTSTSQLTMLRTAANSADNYGQRIRGYLCAPASGSYTFYIQGDDVAEFYLSTDSDPTHKQRIAAAKLAWSWTVSPSQQSAPISLIAGKSYYLEVLHKEANGGDQVRVGWRTPGMATDAEPIIIPGSVLSPFIALPNNGLLACYAFSGNANDGSGLGNHGTLHGGVNMTEDRFGNPNSAYNFQSIGDYIRIPATSLHNNTYTYSIWVKAYSLPPPQRSFLSIFSIGGSGGEQAISLTHGFGTGPTEGWTGGGDNSQGDPSLYHIGSLPELNTWYHLALTRSDAAVSFYVNGQLAGTAPTHGFPAAYKGDNAIIGAQYDLSHYFIGAIDDIQLYNRPLSAAEVKALYQLSGNPCLPITPQPTSGLLACYAFSGNANDGSGQGNNGTVNGATLATDRFGNANSAYIFNGNSDFIDLPSAKLQVAEFSYSLWVKPTALPNTQSYSVPLSIGSYGGDQNVELFNNYLDNPHSSGWQLTSYSALGSASSVTTGSLPPINAWYHLVMTRDANNLRIYVNGTLAGSSASSGPSAYYGLQTVAAYIGKRSSTSSQFFQGAIDDVQIYNKALSAAEVTSLYQQTGNPCSTTTAARLSEPVQEGLLSQLKVYPNPTTGATTVEFTAAERGWLGVQLYNLQGQPLQSLFGEEVEAGATYQRQYDATLLPSGLYLIRLVNGKQVAHQKLLVSH